ncbi:hypothetical protein LINPERPRIM_LOCUS13758, partial [Linum perenne]
WRGWSSGKSNYCTLLLPSRKPKDGRTLSLCRRSLKRFV